MPLTWIDDARSTQRGGEQGEKKKHRKYVVNNSAQHRLTSPANPFFHNSFRMHFVTDVAYIC